MISRSVLLLVLVCISVCWVLAEAHQCPRRLLCGTDGATYKNWCEFVLAQQEDADLQVLYEGSCLQFIRHLRWNRRIYDSEIYGMPEKKDDRQFPPLLVA